MLVVKLSLESRRELARICYVKFGVALSEEEADATGVNILETIGLLAQMRMEGQRKDKETDVSG